jgi:peptidoglycan/xylan/chitin deacetylase (PgdA/CDA1 family)
VTGARQVYRPPALLAGSFGLHLGSLLALAAAPGYWPTVAGALVANHVVLAAASLSPRSRWVGPNLVRLPEDAARRGEVALTFDDGPDPQVTMRVLDLLDGAGARATFFCIGRRAEAYRDVTAEIARRGHRVENHSHTHPHLFACYPWGAMRREIERAQETIADTVGRRPRLFRAPAGFRNPLLDGVLHRNGLRLVSWTRRGFDAIGGHPDAIARRLLRGLAEGDILLLHDGSTLRAHGGNRQVLEVLPRVLDALAARGLRSVPIEVEDE